MSFKSNLSLAFRSENSIIPESDLSFGSTVALEKQLRSLLCAYFPNTPVKPKPYAILSGIIKSSLLIASTLLVGCADFQQAELAYQQQDYQLARQNWQALADLGFPKAHMSLGRMIEQSPEKEQVKALEHYQHAYKLGYERAAYQIGKYYFKHSQNAQDLALAEEWAIKSAKLGNPTAYLLYADIQLHAQASDKKIASALAIYKKLSAQGNAKASKKLASLYEKGVYVNQDFSKALHFYKLALTQGQLEAELDIARFYANGYGVATDFAKAEEIYQRFFEEGTARAAYQLGLLKQRQAIAEKQPLQTEAAEWFKASAELGYIPAKLKYIDLILQGLVADTSPEVAFSQLKELSAANEGQASYKLARLISKAQMLGTAAEELAYYQLAYQQGYQLAAHQIARMYYTQPTLDNAAELHQQWLAKAELQAGDAAQLGLAGLLLHGTGAAQDSAKAITIYQTLSAKGNNSATRNLGKISEQGLTVEQDYPQALSYFKLAVEQGNSDAELDIARFYALGLGVEVNLPLANTTFLRYAEAGNSKAAFLLANNLEQQSLAAKQGIPKQAVYWYTQAAEQGHLESQLKLISIKLDSQQPQDIAKAKAELLVLSQQGIKAASLQLAELYEQEGAESRTQAIHFYQVAFFQGANKPVTKLANYYQQAPAPNDTQLISDYQTAVTTHRPNAAYLLARLHESQANNPLAIKYYLISAEAKHPESQSALINLYETTGQHNKANAWLKKAAATQNGQVMLKYGTALFWGRTIKVNKIEGLAYVIAAARLHTPNAVRNALILMNRLNNKTKIKRANQRSKLILQTGAEDK